MRGSRLTTRLLVGCGVVAGVLLAGAGAAWADHQPGNPPPKQPVITSAPTSPGTDSTPTWAWTDPEGQATTCELRFEGATVFGPTPCTSPITYDLAAQPYGTYTFLVENVDAWSSSTYERLPAPPVITAGPTSPGNDATPTWSFTLPPGTAGQCTLLQGATVVDGPVACAGTQTFTLTADGTYTFRVVAVGNSLTSAPDTSTYTFDSTPPPDPVITGEPTSPSADSTPTWTFTTSGDTASALCSVSGGVAAPAPCTSPATYDLSAQPGGSYTFTVIAVDAAGNQSSPVTSSVDWLAPPVITSAPATPDNDPSPTWTFTVAAGATGECTLLQGATVVSGPAPCAGTASYTLVADGAYTFSVEAVDGGSGLHSSPTTSAYTFDATPPPAPVVTGFPSSPTADDTPTFTFTTSGDTVGTTCSITGQAPAPCTSPVTFDLTGQPAGLYTATFTALDAAGNTTSTPFAFERIVPPPPPTITDAPVSPDNDPTPTWQFTLPPGTVGRCTLLDGATVVSGPVDCVGGHTFTVAGDATYTFQVVAIDLVTSLESTPTTSTYTYDATAPAVPVITSAPPSPVYEDFPTWAFTVSGDTVSTLCSVTGPGAVVVYAEATCTSPAPFDLVAQPDGAYTFSVKAVDAVGNVSAPATSTYTLDRTPPTPTITSSPTTPGNDTTPTWVFTTPAGTVTECTLLFGATVVAGPVSCSGSHTFTVTTDGAYTFQVVAIYTAISRTGAPASSTYTLDTTGPVAPVFTSQPTSPSNSTNPRWTFTSSADTVSRTCTLTRDGATVSSGGCGGAFQPNLNNRPDGVYTLTVVPFDALGNAGTPAIGTYTLDRVAPAAPNLTSGPTTLTNTSLPTWTFTTDPGTTTTCSLTSGGQTISAPTACSESVSYDLSGVPDGNFTLNLLSRDAAGNTSSLAVTFAVDRTPPATPKIIDGPSGTSSDDSPTWKFTTQGQSTARCSVLSGATVVIGPVLCGSPAAFDLTDQPDGVYTFQVVATDAAGNASAPATSSYSLRTGRVAPTPTPAPTPTGPPPAPTPPPAVPGPVVRDPFLPDDDDGTGTGRTPRPAPTPAPGPAPAPEPGPTTPTTVDSGPTAPVERIIEQAGRVVTEASRRAAFPLLLLGLVFLFLVIQNRIDRRDPKLAQAPVHAGDELEFGPPPSRRGRQ